MGKHALLHRNEACKPIVSHITCVRVVVVPDCTYGNNVTAVPISAPFAALTMPRIMEVL